MYNTTSGLRNTAVGNGALYDNGTGADNVAVGYNSGQNISTGNQNTFIGVNSGTTAAFSALTNATALGANAVVEQSNALVLGSSSVSVGIGTTTPDAKLQVVGNIRVGTSGTNGCIQRFDGATLAGTCSSDARLKENIEPFGRMLDRVARLQPVHYTWRAQAFPAYRLRSGSVVAGLVAQDVEQVFPDMVTTDDHGYKMVDYAELPYVTLQAVKDLKGENDALKAQLAEVLARLAQLEKK
jgi:autotransporter adhesin